MIARKMLPYRRWLAGLAIVIAWLLLPPQSQAGTYHVYSCRIPYGPDAGEPAPVEEVLNESGEAPGWSHFVVGDAQYASLCSSGGAIAASLPSAETHTETDVAGWKFVAPPNETIADAKLWLAGDASGGDGYLFWLSTPTNPPPATAFSSEDFVMGCVYILGCRGIGDTAQPLAEANQVTVPASNLGGSHLYINASCSSGSCPSNAGDGRGHAVVVYVYAADISLEQDSFPTVSEVSGELATAESVSGTAALDFQAADSGSGIFREIVSIDGQVVESPVVDETGHCQEVLVPAEDQPAFLSAQPCPASASGRVSIDTTKLSNGPHRLLVEVTDAAGNSTTVLERTIDVANATNPQPPSGAGQQNQSPGQEDGPNTGTTPNTAAQQTGPTTGPAAGAAPGANGTDPSTHATIAAKWARSRDAQVGGAGRLQLTGSLGVPETITGTLTSAAGTPIAHATIAGTVRESYGGASQRRLPSIRTDAQGRFVVHLPPQSPSEQIQLSYSPSVDGPAVASRGLQLRVRAEVALHVTPSSTSAGQTIRLQGSVKGTPIPPGGKQVVLEARSQGSQWLQFLVVHTSRNGHFAGTHRFRLPGPVRYWFRAVCPHEADFPFTTGNSRQATVWER